MISTIISVGHWQVDFSNPLIILSTIVLLTSLIFAIRASWRRLYDRNPGRALLVATLNILAFSAVLLLLIEPGRQHMTTQDILLVTEGATLTNSSLDSRDTYVAPDAATPVKDRDILKNANWLLDIGQLNLREPALTAIKVIGYGLEKEQWLNITTDIHIDFEPAALDGFTEMHWPRSLFGGGTLAVNGRYTQANSDSVIRLRLLDPAGNMVNETRIKNGGSFVLLTRPKGHGNLAYQLQAWEGETLQSEEIVNVSVVETSPPKIMVEQSAPSFETRQLKNFATSQGAQVIINTQISKNNSISQSSNRPEDADAKFTPGNLGTADILIMDGRALTRLAVSQLQWLTEAVEQGLGLLILADDSLVQDFDKFQDGLLDGFGLKTDRETKTEAVPYLQNLASGDRDLKIALAPMRLQAATAKTEGTGIDVLVTDGQQAVLVAKRSKGSGKVAISLISQSHAWLTSGRRDSWSDYWSTLVSALGRPSKDSYLIPQADMAFYTNGNKTPVCAFSKAKSLMAIITPPNAGDMYSTAEQTSFEIPLAADALGSPRKCGWFWPQNAGWHKIQLRTEPDAPLLGQSAVYILQKNQWLTQKRHERVTASLDHLAGIKNLSSTPGSGKWVLETLEAFWPWLLLIFSASLLWLERKFEGWL